MAPAPISCAPAGASSPHSAFRFPRLVARFWSVKPATSELWARGRSPADWGRARLRAGHDQLYSPSANTPARLRVFPEAQEGKRHQNPGTLRAPLAFYRRGSPLGQRLLRRDPNTEARARGENLGES